MTGRAAGLTVELLRKVKPADEPFEIRDKRMPSLLLRVEPEGSMTYILEVGWPEKRFVVGSADEMKPAEAREAARQIIHDRPRDGDPIAEQEDTMDMNTKAVDGETSHEHVANITRTLTLAARFTKRREAARLFDASVEALWTLWDTVAELTDALNGVIVGEGIELDSDAYWTRRDELMAAGAALRDQQHNELMDARIAADPELAAIVQEAADNAAARKAAATA